MDDEPAGRDVDPPEHPPISVGQALAEARAAAGLSIEDVAATTRIRASLVQAMERDDFSGCGGAFYARAHVRTIARLVDADADFLVAEYDRQHGPPPTSAHELAAPATLTHTADAAARKPASRWAVAAIAVVAILVIVLIGRWALSGSDGQGNQTKPGPRPHPVATSTHSSASPTPTPSASSTPTPTRPTQTTPSPSPTPTGVSLAIDVTVRSWVQVTASSGAEVYQGVLEAGENRTFTDPASLTVRFGNAPGVTVSLNGRPARQPCPQYVCTVQFTPQSGAAR